MGQTGDVGHDVLRRWPSDHQTDTYSREVAGRYGQKPTSLVRGAGDGSDDCKLISVVQI